MVVVPQTQSPFLVPYEGPTAVKNSFTLYDSWHNHPLPETTTGFSAVEEFVGTEIGAAFWLQRVSLYLCL